MQKLRNEANFVCPSPAPALTACTSTNVTVPVCTSGGTDVTNISQVMCNSSAMPNMTEMTCCPLNRCPTSLSRESASTSVTSNSDSHSVHLSTSLIPTATRVSLTLELTASAGDSGSISNSSNVSRKSSASASRTVSTSPFASASPKSLSKTVSRNSMSLSLSNSQTSSIRVSPSLIASMTRQTPPLERTASISATGTGSISSSSNITSQSSSCNQSTAFSFSATVSRSVSVSSTHSIGSASPTPTATSSRDDVTPSLSTSPSASKSASPTPSQSPDSRSDSHSKGSQSGSASVPSVSSSPSVDSRRATANRIAALLQLSPTMVSVAARGAADTTDSYARTDVRTFTADLSHSTTLSATPPASMSATKPLFINVTGDLFDSIVDELIPPGRKNETTLTVVAAHDGGVVATRRAYFSIPKVIALKANGGVVSVMLRLLPQLTMRFSLTGQRIALGTEGLTATVVNQTILLLSMRATGSQYLATVANINIPLVNLLAGNVRVTGRTELPIQFVLTATTVTALTVTTSIASVTGPISAVAGTTPASAMAVLRLSILIDILQCGFGGDDGGANLFSLAIGPSPGASLRGAVVGNLVFIAAFAALLGILILAFLAYGWVTLNAPLGAMLPDLLNIFHFPGIVLIPVSAVCQPTLTAAVQLIASPPLHGDVTFGVLGAVALLLLLMLPYTIVIATQFCLKLVEENVSEAHQQRGARLSSLLRRFVSMLFSERATWQPIDPARRDHVAWKKRFAPVFIDCSVWWYPLVDLWCGAAVGVVGGLTLGNKSVCLFQLAVVAFSYAIIALLQLVVAPPLVFVSRCYVVVLQVLGLISCGAVLAATVTNDSEDSTSVAVASVSMLLIAVLSTVKSALDVLFLLLAIPGRIRRAAGVGALHGVPTLSSPCGSFHWRSSDVEL
ncbi:transmembrane protein, putative, partial [Bodo saltans]